MAWYDVEESRSGAGIDAVTSMADHADEAAGRVPILGNAWSLGQAMYHGGSAIYDGVTGDRDGAIDHGTQALWNGLGMLPGVGDAMEGAEAGAGMLGLGAREVTHHAGGDASQVPDGLDALAGQWAVGATNAIFGADDSNWIAEGDKPTGTRQGEIAAGINMMLGGPLGLYASDLDGGLGGMAAEGIGSLFGSEATAGTTSGAKPGWAASTGAELNEEWGGNAAGTLGGAMLGAAFGPMGILMGAGLGGTAGLLDETYEYDPSVAGGMIDALAPAMPGLGRPGMQMPDDLSALDPVVAGMGRPGMQMPDDLSALDPFVAGLGMPGMLLPSATATAGGGTAGAGAAAAHGQVANGGGGGAAGGNVGAVPGGAAAGAGSAAGTGKTQPTGGDISPYLPPMFESVGHLF